MKTTGFHWNRSHTAIAGLFAVALMLVVANTFRTIEAAAEQSYEGTVMSTGDSTLMIQTAPDSDARSFDVASDAKITKDGEKSTLDRVVTGDLVTIAVSVRDAREVALNIVARSPQ